MQDVNSGTNLKRNRSRYLEERYSNYQLHLIFHIACNEWWAYLFVKLLISPVVVLNCVASAKIDAVPKILVNVEQKPPRKAV